MGLKLRELSPLLTLKQSSAHGGDDGTSMMTPGNSCIGGQSKYGSLLKR